MPGLFVHTAHQGKCERREGRLHAACRLSGLEVRCRRGVHTWQTCPRCFRPSTSRLNKQPVALGITSCCSLSASLGPGRAPSWDQVCCPTHSHPRCSGGTDVRAPHLAPPHGPGILLGRAVPLVCPAPFLTVIVTVVPGGGCVHWALRVLSLLMVEGERGG